MTPGNSVRSATLGAAASILVCVTAALIAQSCVMRNMGIDSLRQQIEAALIQAENVRGSISRLNQDQAFDVEKLKSELSQTSDYRQSKLYRTVPVVASWNAVRQGIRRGA